MTEKQQVGPLKSLGILPIYSWPRTLCMWWWFGKKIGIIGPVPCTSVRPDGRTLRPREVRFYYSRRRALRHQQDLCTGELRAATSPVSPGMASSHAKRRIGSTCSPFLSVFVGWIWMLGPAHLSLLVGSTPVRCRVLLSECFFSCISLITSGPAFLYHRHLLQLTIVDRHLLDGQFACRYWLLLSGTHSHTHTQEWRWCFAITR